MRKPHFVNIPKNLAGKKVLLRADFNEPVEKGKIKDSFRIGRTRPTIHELLGRGASVICLSHLEDSNGALLSFKKHVRELEKVLRVKLLFSEKYKKQKIPQGSVMLLENLRFHKGEKENTPSFAKLLSSLADLYVNEAFSVSHRQHASIVGVPKFLPSYAGPLFAREVAVLSEALHPSHPFLLIIGGLKFKTKYPLLKNFLGRADGIFVGGALANTFFKAKGLEIGRSVFDREALGSVKRELLSSKKILLPIDLYVRSATVRDASEIKRGERILDVGPKTLTFLRSIARLSKLIVWNGPLGYIERGFDKGTKDLLRFFSGLKIKVILGGGDTLEVLDHMRLEHKFYHVSTGGGAMLDFLADGTLPGIEALLEAQK
ncbi:MAG: phosphoglycerate kinase [Candidatus Ryanbacteria bacterium]|nr:phosphoglycerate kinase [Candidatus Ryanbacteria bacterium]